MPKHRARRITIVEGQWDKNHYISVREVIAPLFNLLDAGGTCYHYVTFLDSASWVQACSYVFAHGMPKLVYVAAHGSRKGIYGLGAKLVSRTNIGNALYQGTKRTTPKQLYFGSCDFCTPNNARFLFNKCDKIEWIAGYDKSVDWVDSTAFDILFLRHLLHPSKKRGPRAKTQLSGVRLAVKKTRDIAGGLGDELGFHLYAKRGGKDGGGVVDLWAKSKNSPSSGS